MDNNKTILIVDDVDFFRDLMQRYLQKTPVNTIVANGGRQAIDLALQHTPDVICMDVAMPELNGVLACREIKAHPKLKNIPIILLYNPTHPEEVAMIETAACNDTLAKPLSREDFLNLTHRHLFHVDRRERRVACQMTVECRGEKKSIQGLGIDISRSGLYIEYRGEVPAERTVDVSFYLASITPEKVEVRANIAWVNQGHPRPNLSMPSGLGIAFEEMSPVAKAVIDRFIADN